MVVRGCAVDSGSLTADTELVRGKLVFSFFQIRMLQKLLKFAKRMANK